MRLMQKDDELGNRLGGVRVCKGCARWLKTIDMGETIYRTTLVNSLAWLVSIMADCMENTHSMSSSHIDPCILTPGAAMGPLFTGMAMVPTSIPSSARKYGELRKLRGVGRPPIMLRKRIGSSLLVALAPRCENGGRSATCSTLPSTSARGNEGERREE